MVAVGLVYWSSTRLIQAAGGHRECGETMQEFYRRAWLG